MTLTHDEKIARFVERRRAALEVQDHTWSKLRVVLRECGWKKRGPGNLRRIQARCEATGIYPEPMLTAPGLDYEETIYFSRVEPKPYVAEHYSPHAAFSSERALQRFLAHNLARILKRTFSTSPMRTIKLNL